MPAAHNCHAHAAMRMIPDMSLREVDEGMGALGKGFAKVADADLDAMFVQVRCPVCWRVHA